MCSSKSKLHSITPKIAQINGRAVLQPTSNQVPSLEKCNSIKIITSLKSPPATTNNVNRNSFTKPSLSSLAVNRGNVPNELNSSAEKFLTPKKLASPIKKQKNVGVGVASSYDSSLIIEAPGRISAARREHVAIMQQQRKSRIAHYGRTKPAKLEGKATGLDASAYGNNIGRWEKRCSFITPNSDPIYVANHDEEWGVPVHDDQLLFELLLLTAAQVGSDWTSVLKKRQVFREAFSGFDAEAVAKFTEKKITSLSAEYGFDLSQIRGIVDNSIRIIEVKKQFGSFDKYLWGFVNHKQINTQYRSSQKIPLKTSKSESISKDMVKRGFRFVGPTVVHSFMQAAGLTNAHLITCPRHLQCLALASHQPADARAL